MCSTPETKEAVENLKRKYPISPNYNDRDFNNKQTAACTNDATENISHTPCSSPVKKKMKHEVCSF